MTNEEKIIDMLAPEGVVVDDRLLGPGDLNGMYMTEAGKPPIVLVNRKLHRRRKLCVLAEEAGHHFKSSGPALNPRDVTEWKNELSGRRWAYRHLVPGEKVIAAWDNGDRELWTMARFCGVTCEFLEAAINYYHGKHGSFWVVGNRAIQFDPFFHVWYYAG